VAIAGEEADAWRAGDWGKAAAIDVVGELLVGLGLQLAFLAAVNGYGRDLEAEADRGGFAKLEAAGYRAEEAPKMYETLLAAAGPEHGRATTFFFASHPRLSERIDNARAWALAQPPAEPPPAERGDLFHRRLRPVVRDNGVLHLDAGRFDEAERDLQRALDWLPADPVAHYQLGRLRLAQADAAADDDERLARRGEAETALREAIRLDADYPPPHRQLGLVLYARGDLAAACRSFGHYLELAPAADDAARIEDYRRELVAQGACGAG
jgi:predicted Zn-dependent protease